MSDVMEMAERVSLAKEPLVAAAMQRARESTFLAAMDMRPEFADAIAREAIKALREPTHTMADAGEAAFEMETGVRNIAIEVWRGMIAAALRTHEATDGE